jgi:hypothetical protein
MEKCCDSDEKVFCSDWKSGVIPVEKCSAPKRTVLWFRWKSVLLRIEKWCDADGKVTCSEWESVVIPMEKCPAPNRKVV